ncbi:MAG: trypsin-like peptidase domain-containing protein [Phycisphaerae bacterium]|jgi:S1-C subfamily serine protease
MRPQLLHLSGPYRGRTITYAREKLVFGSTEEADVRYPGWTRVADRHALLEFVEEGCCFYLKAVEGQVFVNRQEIREVILESGDLLEIGVGGPKLRFRIDYSDGKPCKPVRQMLRDVRDVGGHSGFLAGTKALRHDLLGEISWPARATILLVLVFAMLAAGHVGGFIGSKRTARKQEMLRAKEAESYQKEFAKIREQVEAFGREQAGHASRQEVERLRADLARRARVVDELVQRNVALRQVLEVHSGGVCLVHGRFTFTTTQDVSQLPVVGVDGNPLELEYFGSGFLVSTDGTVITNRHVAEPWWNNSAVKPLLDQAMTPAFTHLTATFPGKPPEEIDPTTIRLSPDDMDVAVFKVAVQDVPVLPLFSGDLNTIRGGRVIVLGYPTGLTAILARADPGLASEILDQATDTTSLVAALAAEGAISPVITQGALNEVKEKKLVYDAETTSGGSGGPVFGPDGTVIGVNFAITHDFDGSNFGVPIRFAKALVP